MKTFHIHTNFGVKEIEAKSEEAAKEAVRELHPHRLTIFSVEQVEGTPIANEILVLFGELEDLTRRPRRPNGYFRS